MQQKQPLINQNNQKYFYSFLLVGLIVMISIGIDNLNRANEKKIAKERQRLKDQISNYQEWILRDEKELDEIETLLKKEEIIEYQTHDLGLRRFRRIYQNISDKLDYLPGIEERRELIAYESMVDKVRNAYERRRTIRSALARNKSDLSACKWHLTDLNDN